MDQSRREALEALAARWKWIRDESGKRGVVDDAGKKWLRALDVMYVATAKKALRAVMWRIIHDLSFTEVTPLLQDDVSFEAFRLHGEMAERAAAVGAT